MSARSFWTAFAAAFAAVAAAIGIALWAVGRSGDGGSAGPPSGGSQSETAAAEQSGPAQPDSPSPTTATQPLVYGDFEDGSYAVPAGCWSLLTTADTTPGAAHFEGGSASSEYAGASASLNGFEQLSAGGQDFAAVGFSCTGGGTYYQEFWGIYDSQMNLVDQGASLDVPEVAPALPGAVGGPVESQGEDTFSYVIAPILLGGDAGAGSGSATVTYRWDGSNAAVADVVYDLPTGQARMPDQQEVQALYDLLSQDDPAAMDQVSAGVKEQIQAGFGDQGQVSYLETITPVGGTVRDCVLGGAISDGGTRQYYLDGDGITFPTVEYLDPGYFYCGIDTTEVGGWSPSEYDGTLTYNQWFMVRSDLSGTPFVEDIPRTFS